MASDITAPSKSREKVVLKPGYHLANWVKRIESLPRSTSLRKISIDEVRLHNTESDCWTIINGKVYDITDYIPYHPGGVKKLMLGAGTDCTKLFVKFHAWVNVDAMIGKCCVGVIGNDTDTLVEDDEEDITAMRELAINNLTTDNDDSEVTTVARTVK